MGQGSSKYKPNIDASTAAPGASSHFNKEHLILAFFAGVLLTLLLTALIFFIIKCCRKCRSRPQTLEPHSDPPTRDSPTPVESLIYASMTFEPSEEKSSHLTANHSAHVDPIVYAQIK